MGGKSDDERDVGRNNRDGGARLGPGAADDGVRYGKGQGKNKSTKILFVASLAAEATEMHVNKLFTDYGFNWYTALIISRWSLSVYMRLRLS